MLSCVCPLLIQFSISILFFSSCTALFLNLYPIQEVFFFSIYSVVITVFFCSPIDYIQGLGEGFYYGKPNEPHNMHISSSLCSEPFLDWFVLLSFNVMFINCVG
uniref:(northern house mosquito) hypothetical protein n=1 Tax=Culex pipiens TaxID=7175 RepID=A0A8D8DPX6_CULPI